MLLSSVQQHLAVPLLWTLGYLRNCKARCPVLGYRKLVNTNGAQRVLHWHAAGIVPTLVLQSSAL